MRVGAVLMASGAAVRFGRNKLLQPVDGLPMIQRALEAVPARLFDRAALVSSFPEVLALGEKAGFLPVFNPQAAEGQSASIRLGLSALGETDGALFAVCDQPWLTQTSVRRLLEAFSRCPDWICALSWQGQRGNPVLFPAWLFPELLTLTGSRGGGAVIRAHRDRLRLVEVNSPRELQDVDTPEDLL